MCVWILKLFFPYSLPEWLNALFYFFLQTWHPFILIRQPTNYNEQTHYFIYTKIHEEGKLSAAFGESEHWLFFLGHINPSQHKLRLISAPKHRYWDSRAASLCSAPKILVTALEDLTVCPAKSEPVHRGLNCVHAAESAEYTKVFKPAKGLMALCFLWSD